MNLLSADNISKSYGDRVLFNGISFGVDDADRIGLIGANGAGKSTLLKVIAGIEPPASDAGAVTLGSRVIVHYLPQEPEFSPDGTVLDQVLLGDGPVVSALREYARLVEAAGQRGLTGQQQTRLAHLQSQLDSLDGWRLEHEAKNILTRLGVSEFRARVGDLSGGQRKRVALARALIQPCDLLVLDEPTNHIDNETVAWLEAHLQRRRGALFMVTHDRYFLERVVNRIFELDRGSLYQYTGNYEAFLEAKLARAAARQASEAKRQNFLRTELEWIKRGPKARGTKQKARTDRYHEVLDQAPEEESATLAWSGRSARLGNVIIELDQVTKRYGGRTVASGFTYRLQRRDRIGVVGANGSGKSTLLKLMAGLVEPDAGAVVVGSTVKLGYLPQELDEPPGDQRVIDYIREVAEHVEIGPGLTLSATQMLERFLFPGSVQWMPVGRLSGGEKRRLAMLGVLMQGPNVLLLDELTNDLDIATLSVLESYLDDFPGAVVVVSHDRYFLDRVVDDIFAFEGDGRVGRYAGNFSAYQAIVAQGGDTAREPGGTAGDKAALRRSLDQRQSAQSRQSVESAEQRQSAESVESAEHPSGQGPRKKPIRLSFSEQREYDGIEDEIARAEHTLHEITREMEQAGGDFGRIQELYGRQQAAEARINQLLERWTYLCGKLEEIERARTDA